MPLFPIRGPLEIRLLAGGGRARTRGLRLSVAVQRALAALAIAFALALLIGLATAPATISSLLLKREYAVQATRRLQLGERLQALVDRLQELQRRGAEISGRLKRIQAIYEIPETAGARPAAVSAASAAPDSIFASTIVHGNRLEASLVRDLELARLRLEVIAAFERSHLESVAAVPARSPLGGSTWVLTSGFGPRRSPFTRELELHTGLDLAAPVGTAVRAAAAGVVSYAGLVEADRRSDWWRMGRLVVVRHGEQFLTLYGHCDELLVRAGQRIAAGTRVATVGESGWTTAPHLHYEIRRRRPSGAWEAVDPLDYALALAAEGELPAERRRVAPDPALGAAAPLLPAFLR